MIKNVCLPRDLAEDEILRAICAALVGDRLEEARNLTRSHFPTRKHNPIGSRHRSFSIREQVAVFLRDGFVDRYSGRRLVLPAALRVMSVLMPEEIPYHRNLKACSCHEMFWEMAATVNHIRPESLGGSTHRENLVTTSVLRHMIKAKWTLEQIGWELHKPGDMFAWDGLSRWFLQTYRKHPRLAGVGDLKSWALAVEHELNHYRTGFHAVER